ncbi:MAG: cytochrome-c peroxidase, partial [Deferrisomatales bacterium]
MFEPRRPVVVAALGAVLLVASGAGAAATPEPLEELGRQIFFDLDLSVNRTQSCASCHDPATGYTGPDSWVNLGGSVVEGAVPGRFGNRKPPSAAYAGDSPALRYDGGARAWIGGMFWDGRATGWTLGDPLAEQAQGPFLNPLEQALPHARQACIRVAHSAYAGPFEAVWGPGSLDFVKDVAGTYERIAHSVAAFERSAEVNPFTSRFDRFWDNARAAGKTVARITAAGIPGGMGMGGGGMGGGGMGGGGMGGGSPQNNPSRWEHYRNL